MTEDFGVRDGKTLEQDVRLLLDLQGWRVVQECLISHKKVDAYAEKVGDFGSLTRLAIECKDYSNALTQEEMSRIYANYLPLLQQGLIDQLLVVTRTSVAPSAKTFASSARGLVHITHLDLLNSLLDMSGYVTGVIAQYRSDDVCHYYIDQSFACASSNYTRCSGMEKALLQWIEEPTRQPVAILGGYGMGKSTLLKRVACTVAEQYAQDSELRVPIVIRLEEISAEQSLEGLLGKHFTSGAVVRNYNFNTFMELNRRGRFVVFLDGFDEMKHTMSWEIMRFNFQQLVRLVVGDAKVVIAGRPSAFLSEEEYAEALHGNRRVMGQWKHIPGWPDFLEFYLQPFTVPQMGQFVEAYHRMMSNRDSVNKAKSLGEIGGITSETNPHLTDLASRPVQLKMLMEVLPTWQRDVDSLTVPILYAEFIDLIIRREMEKGARKNFSLQKRRDFLRDLAWWMWVERTGGAVLGGKLPDALFQPYLLPEHDLTDIKRDLLNASIVEVKQPDGYYFPHRSFQEFLVAEKLLALVRSGELPTMGDIAVTPEIIDFFSGLVSERDLHAFKRLACSARGVLPDWVFQVGLATVGTPDQLVDDPETMCNPWPYVLVAYGLLTQRWSLKTPGVAKFLRDELSCPPPGNTSDPDWLGLFRTLIIMLYRELKELGIDLNDRMLQLVQTKQSQAFLGGKKVSAASLITRPKNLCWVASWEKKTLENSNLYFNLGRHKQIEHTDKINKKTSKTPHRRKGVTQKRKF